MSALLIRDGAVLTPQGWIDPGYVWIDGATIRAVGAGAPPPEIVAQAETILDARQQAVLPGLVNGHTHLSQTFMRGLAGGRPLLAWLKELIWPLQGAMTPEILHLAALLGLVENLRCGATTVVNHHKVATTPAHTDAVCQAAGTVRLRLVLARAWADRGTNAEAPEAILADLTRLFERWSGAERLMVANGPLVPWRCSAETLQRTHALALQHGSFTHIHVAETGAEVQMTRDETGLPPVLWLDALGVLGPDAQIVHSVWVSAEEIDRMAARGALVVHCPVSNAVLGSGIAPLAALLRAGIRVRLGTDGPASNDTQDTFETLKQALCLARAQAGDPQAIAPETALALALDGRTLVPGAPADVILVDLDHARVLPVHDVTSALVLSTHGSDVTTAIVGGEVLLRDRRVLVLDEDALRAECRSAVRTLRKLAGLD